MLLLQLTVGIFCLDLFYTLCASSVSVRLSKRAMPSNFPKPSGEARDAIIYMLALAVLLTCSFSLPLLHPRPAVRTHVVLLAAKKPPGRRQVASNKLARRNFEILQELEAGISLVGTEVKSARNGRINLRALACACPH